jgi:NCS1 family nucleobase:cation symporter-1
MISDYWIVRRRKIKLSDLYHDRKDGTFFFWHGVNWRSFVAWIIGWSYLIPGLANAVGAGINVPAACAKLYYLAFPLGFVVSSSIYVLLNLFFPPEGLGVVDEVDEFDTFTLNEGQKLGVLPVTQGNVQIVEDELQRPDEKTNVVCK